MIRTLIAIGAIGGGVFATTVASRVATQGQLAEQTAIGVPLPAELAAGANGAGLAAAPLVDTAGNAQEKLLRSPLYPHAIWERAVALERSNPSQANQLVSLAAKVTRRHFPSAVWLLEKHVAEGSVSGTLTQYDVLLTLVPALGQRLFGQLAIVGGEVPEVKEGLLSMTARPWFGGFLNTAAKTNGELYLPHMARYAQTLPADERTRVYGSYLSGMLAGGAFEAVRRYALRAADVPDALVTALDPTPETTDIRWGRLSWTMASSPKATASLSDHGKAVDVLIQPDSSAQIMARTTLFPKGSYRLEYATELDRGTEAPVLVWELNCVMPSEPGARTRIGMGTITTDPSRQRTVDLVIPDRCPIQQWTVRALADAGQTPKSLRLDRFSLVAHKGQAVNS
jgi:hypothetical protein